MNNPTSTTKFSVKRIAALVATVVILAVSLSLGVACKSKALLSGITAVYSGGEVEVGGSLDKNDVAVTAKYSDGTIKVVTDGKFTYDFSVAGQCLVVVSYGENGRSYDSFFYVDVVEKTETPKPVATLSSITAVYNGPSIRLGGKLKNDDIIVTAHYSDDGSKTVTNFAVGGFSSAKAGVTQAEISYSEGEVTQVCKISVTVMEHITEVADYGKYGLLQEDGSIKITNTAIVDDDLQIHFLAFENNSPGDSIYIKAGEVDILIDAGSTTTSANTIAKYIDNYVTDGKLEYVIATHSDTDHIYAFIGSSSAQGILDRYEIGNIITYPAYYGNKGGYMGDKTATQTKFEEKCQAKAEQGTNLFTDVECYNNAKEGAQRVYKLTDNIEMEVLYNAYYTTKGSNNNNYSVCLMFNQYGDGYDFDNPENPDNKNYVNHFLFTGDLEGNGEELLVQNNDLPEVVLFKGGHHGSATSSNIVLLDKIKPKFVCVCTCCGDGRYGFPKQEFVDRTAKYTDMVFLTNQNVSGSSYTHLNGNIAVKSNSDGVFVNCSNNNILFKDSEWFKNNRDYPPEWKPLVA